MLRYSICHERIAHIRPCDKTNSNPAIQEIAIHLYPHSFRPPTTINETVKRIRSFWRWLLYNSGTYLRYKRIMAVSALGHGRELVRRPVREVPATNDDPIIIIANIARFLAWIFSGHR